MAKNKDKFQKKKLYRKVNSRAIGCHHRKGPDFKNERNTKNPDESMKQGVKRGLDYKPLYKFLLSKVGEEYDKVLSEAHARLDDNKEGLTRILDSSIESFRQENSYFSTLHKDSEGNLQKINPNLTIKDFIAYCPCCTHTFNGKEIPYKH